MGRSRGVFRERESGITGGRGEGVGRAFPELIEEEIIWMSQYLWVVYMWNFVG
jgi:hypothetical protein